LYGYVGNTPTGFTDPSGLDPEYDQQLWRAQQDVIEALEPVIGFGVGFGDEYLLGIPRKIRQWQGIDSPNLDCLVSYQAGQWTAIAAQAAEAGVGIFRGALKLFGKAAGKELLEDAGKLCFKCFEAETSVQTDEGLKPIEKIEAGDKVLSYNEETGFLEYQEVLQKFTRVADDIYSVKVEGEEKPLGVTSEHPFFIRIYRESDILSLNESGEWRETRQLKVGDEIKLASGAWAKVLEVKYKGAGQVYNFEVAGNHNYFVGNLRLLTHNVKCPIFDPNQDALIQLVKDAERRGGVTKDQAAIL